MFNARGGRIRGGRGGGSFLLSTSLPASSLFPVPATTKNCERRVLERRRANDPEGRVCYTVGKRRVSGKRGECSQGEGGIAPPRRCLLLGGREIVNRIGKRKPPLAEGKWRRKRRSWPLFSLFLSRDPDDGGGGGNDDKLLRNWILAPLGLHLQAPWKKESHRTSLIDTCATTQ